MSYIILNIGLFGYGPIKTGKRNIKAKYTQELHHAQQSMIASKQPQSHYPDHVLLPIILNAFDLPQLITDM